MGRSDALSVTRYPCSSATDTIPRMHIPHAGSYPAWMVFLTVGHLFRFFERPIALYERMTTSGVMLRDG